MAQLPNHYHKTNGELNKFKDHFKLRCFDGSVIWKLRDLFIEYEEILGIITEYSKENFSLTKVKYFPEEFIVFQTKVKYSKIQDAMEAANTFVVAHNANNRDFENTINSALKVKTGNAYIKSWKSSGKVFAGLRNALEDWKTIIEDNFSVEEIEATIESRQSTLGLKSTSKMSLGEYISERVRISRLKIHYVDETKGLLVKALRYIEPGFKVTSNNSLYMEVFIYALNDIYKAFNIKELKELISSLQKKSNIKKNRIINLPIESKIQPFSFGIKKVKKPPTDFKLDETLSYLQIGNGLDIELHISTLSQITVRDISVKMNLLAGNAKEFAFVYPLSPNDAQKVIEENPSIEQHDDVGLLNLLTVGGYCYRDEREQICSVTGLEKNGIQISFSPVEKVWQANELQNIKFHEITVEALLSKGALKFAWLPPATLGLGGHGGFLYEFKDGAYECFKLIKITQSKAKGDKNNNAKKIQAFMDLLSSNQRTAGGL